MKWKAVAVLDWNYRQVWSLMYKEHWWTPWQEWNGGYTRADVADLQKVIDHLSTPDLDMRPNTGTER